MSWTFALKVGANATAVIAIAITVYATAGMFGFLSSGTPEGIAAGMSQVLLTVVGFTIPVATLWAPDHPIAHAGAIGTNLLIVFGTILVGIPAGDCFANTIFRIISSQIPIL